MRTSRAGIIRALSALIGIVLMIGSAIWFVILCVKVFGLGIILCPVLAIVGGVLFYIGFLYNALDQINQMERKKKELIQTYANQIRRVDDYMKTASDEVLEEYIKDSLGTK